MGCTRFALIRALQIVFSEFDILRIRVEVMSTGIDLCLHHFKVRFCFILSPPLGITVNWGFFLRRPEIPLDVVMRLLWPPPVRYPGCVDTWLPSSPEAATIFRPEVDRSINYRGDFTLWTSFRSRCLVIILCHFSPDHWRYVTCHSYVHHTWQ